MRTRGWAAGGPAGKAVPAAATRGAAVCELAAALSGPARKGRPGKRVAGEPTMVPSSLCERHVTHSGLSELLRPSNSSRESQGPLKPPEVIGWMLEWFTCISR